MSLPPDYDISTTYGRWRSAQGLLNRKATSLREWAGVCSNGNGHRGCRAVKSWVRRESKPTNFSFGSAADVLDDEAGEEGDGVEVGFGFGDGYDFRAASGTREALLKPASNEGGAGVAVETYVGEVVSKGGIVGEDEVAGGLVIVDGITIARRSTPIPDGEVGAGCP